MVEIGQRAPDFTLLDHRGREVSLSDFAGRWLVLYFYPRDNTPGCTKEALDFSQELPAFHALQAEVVGISPDSPQSHRRFRERHGIEVVLLSDPDLEAIKSYGAWGEKRSYGRVSHGVIRSTFIVSPQGEVAAAWRNVRVRRKVKGEEVRHAAVVREELRRLQEAREG